MSRSAEYRAKAAEMMRSARAALTAVERQTYIELAAAWNALAKDVDALDRMGEVIPPFEPCEPDSREPPKTP
jgi:hypothetical protein